MKVLELFSGTESFSNVAKKRGHKTFTVDNEPKFNPDLIKDILKLKVDDIPFDPDIIWASPPCKCFSVASIHWNWIKNEDGTYTPKTDKTIKNMKFVKKTLKLIKKLKPKYYFIENPRAMLRKMSFMEKLPRKTVTYCKYGLPYQKPTDIWTNCETWKPKQMCSPKDSCHIRSPRGSRYGIQGISSSFDRVIVPRKLCLEIIKACEDSK